MVGIGKSRTQAQSTQKIDGMRRRKGLDFGQMVKESFKSLHNVAQNVPETLTQMSNDTAFTAKNRRTSGNSTLHSHRLERMAIH